MVETLLSWYNANKRDLPWRRTKDPYKIWVSEIILQQTRIEQGRDYYERFLERFPTITALAGATEEKVLRVWQGLGYYTRARNMHAAAQQIAEELNGRFPGSYDGIRSLKGIGDYTAAAIGSIAFGLPYPVVDGNVLRFFARYFGIRDPVDSTAVKKKIRGIAEELIPHDDPGTFNQAIMEFGALQCRPGKPDCSICPVKSGCYAFKNKMVDSLPVKKKAPEQRTRYFHYLLIFRKKGKTATVCLNRRTGKDIWQNLYDFPLIESGKQLTPVNLGKTDAWKSFFGKNKVLIHRKTAPAKHILSHQVIVATFYTLDVPVGISLPWTEVPLQELEKYPLPRLIHRALPFLISDSTS